MHKDSVMFFDSTADGKTGPLNGSKQKNEEINLKNDENPVIDEVSPAGTMSI